MSTHGSYSLVKLKCDAHPLMVDGRLVSRHSLFGNLHMARHATALRLINAGLAKMPKHHHLHVLEALAAAAAA